MLTWRYKRRFCTEEMLYLNCFQSASVLKNRLHANVWTRQILKPKVATQFLEICKLEGTRFDPSKRWESRGQVVLRTSYNLCCFPSWLSAVLGCVANFVMSSCLVYEKVNFLLHSCVDVSLLQWSATLDISLRVHAVKLLYINMFVVYKVTYKNAFKALFFKPNVT